MEQSFETLWYQMHSRLCRFICSRLSNGQDAEDILQEVFLRIHNHLESVQDTEKLESWMYQIARNSIIDYYRSRRDSIPLSDPVFDDDTRLAPQLVVPFTIPEEDAAESLAPELRAVVEALPEPYREALILTEFQGLSQQELADRVGISLSGAKSRVQRARQKVKDILLTCCHFEFDARGLVMDYRERCCCCSNN